MLINKGSVLQVYAPLVRLVFCYVYLSVLIGHGNMQAGFSGPLTAMNQLAMSLEPDKDSPIIMFDSRDRYRSVFLFYFNILLTFIVS